MRSSDNLRRDAEEINKLGTKKNEAAVRMKRSVGRLNALPVELEEGNIFESLDADFASEPAPEKVGDDVGEKSDDDDECKRQDALDREEHYRHIGDRAEEQETESDEDKGRNHSL